MPALIRINSSQTARRVTGERGLQSGNGAERRGFDVESDEDASDDDFLTGRYEEKRSAAVGDTHITVYGPHDGFCVNMQQADSLKTVISRKKMVIFLTHYF